VTPIKVQQKSMYPTLNSDDIMILDKLGYSISGADRFNIVVIKYKKDYLIKRVIGLPGETLEYKDSKLYINEKEVNEYFINVKTEDYKFEGKIPKDSYFVMGDNRGNSTDSRLIGAINFNEIIGKTDLIVFPFSRFGTIK
jgi:signal peptidase I